MGDRAGSEKSMPDVPPLDFVGALAEIWFTISYAAYHLAYVRVYSQTAALQSDVDDLRRLEQSLREAAQVDTIICRAHLAALFWQLDHVFEALRAAVTRGQKEHPNLKYFWSYEKKLDEIEQEANRQEINAYRNKAHEIPAIIGQSWEKKGGKFIHHFLPPISGGERKEDIDMNKQLQAYFEYVANVWLSFAPGDLKEKFPRSFAFPVSIPNSFVGELPPGLEKVPQLHVEIEAYNKEAEKAKGAE
jgi:hypothetical protein